MDHARHRSHPAAGAITLYFVALTAACSGVGQRLAPATPPTPTPDPLAEVRHEKLWAEVAPAPLPKGLPLTGPDGLDEAGYPRKVVDGPALRSLLVHGEYARLTGVLEEFQAEFEKDPRYEQRVHDAYLFLGYPHPRERRLIDAWLAATPRSFAPHLASAAYWVNTGFLWRGGSYARDTSGGEFAAMHEALERARADLARALRLRPAVVEAQLWAITVEVAGGTRERAEQAMEDALRRCPSCYQARVAWLWALEPHWGGSLAEMEDFATQRADPANPRHRALQGYVLLERASEAFQEKRRPEALALLDQACAIGGDPLFFQRRAEALVEPDGADAYLADLDRADALHPGLPDVLSKRAWALSRKDRWEEAGRELLRVLQMRPTSSAGNALHPGFVQALDTIAWKEHAAGRDGSGARVYALARALAPDDATVAEHARVLPAAPAGPLPAEQQRLVTGDAHPTLTVVAVDVSGAPVPGARVLGSAEEAGWPTISALLDRLAQHAVRADAAGRAALPAQAGPYSVLAALPEGPVTGGVAGVIVPTTGAEVRLQVGGSAKISGRVIDETGQAVGGLQLQALPTGAEVVTTPRKVAVAVSAPDGSFVIQGVDDREYLLYRPGDRRFMPLRGGAADVVVRVPVQHPPELRGRVLVSRAGKRPVACERFTVRLGADEQQFSTTDGQFSMKLGSSAGGTAYVTVEGLPRCLASRSAREERWIWAT